MGALSQHSHSFGQDKKRSGESRTLIVIAITATMMVVEITAGLLFGSMALLADGLHMASHAAALGIARSSAMARYRTKIVNPDLHICSIAKERELKIEVEGDVVDVEDLLEEWPRDEAALARIRERALANPLYPDLVFSGDLRYTTVALKFLHGVLARRKGLKERFMQEAQVSARIKSVHVVNVSDVDETPDGLAYMVMEYERGVNLEQAIDAGLVLGEAELLGIVHPLLDGLELGKPSEARDEIGGSAQDALELGVGVDGDLGPEPSRGHVHEGAIA